LRLRPFARPPRQARLEALLGARLGEEGVQGPGLDLDEAADLLLAVDDQAQRHRLDPSRADPLLDLAPEEGAEPEAHEAVDDPARLLGVDAVHVDQARVLERLADGL